MRNDNEIGTHKLKMVEEHLVDSIAALKDWRHRYEYDMILHELVFALRSVRNELAHPSDDDPQGQYADGHRV